MGTGLSRGSGSLYQREATPTEPLAHHCILAKVCVNSCCLPPIARGGLWERSGFEGDSLTHQTDPGEGSLFSHHCFCNSDVIWSLFSPSTLPLHCPSSAPVLPSHLWQHFLLHRHPQAMKAPAQRGAGSESLPSQPASQRERDVPGSTAASQ